MGLILHMYTQSIIGSDHEWKVEVPPCVGEPMLWCDKLNKEQDESCTGSGIHNLYRAVHMDKYYFVVIL